MDTKEQKVTNRYQFYHGTADYMIERDTHVMQQTQFRYALKRALLHHHKTAWISIGGLVAEHIIDYDFMTYRRAVKNREAEVALLVRMLPQIQQHALTHSIMVGEISSDISWKTANGLSRILPGVNLERVADIGLLAKDVSSYELLDVQKI